MLLLLSVFAALCCISVHGLGGEACTEEGGVCLVRTPTITRTDRDAGRLEICMPDLNGALVWGTIATNSLIDYWSEKNAQVACRELGYSGSLNVILTDTIPVTDRAPIDTAVHINNVQCDGTESSITGCAYDRVGLPQHNTTFMDVYIVCRPRLRYSALHTGGPVDGDIRLVGDVRNGFGAVEIYSTLLQWSSICPDEAWQRTNADAYCSQLGYETGSTVVYSNISPVAPRLLSDTDCVVGSSDIVRITLRHCSYTPSSPTLCPQPSESFAGIQCSSQASTGDLRLVGGSSEREGIVEIFLNNRWGVICGNSWVSSTFNAETACRQLGFANEDAFTTSSSSFLSAESSLKPLWLQGVSCEEPEESLAGCSRGVPFGYAACSLSSASLAAVDCGEPPPLPPGVIAAIVVPILVVIIGIVLFYIYVVRPKCQKKFGADWDKDCNWYKRWRAQAARERAERERAERGRVERERQNRQAMPSTAPTAPPPPAAAAASVPPSSMTRSPDAAAVIGFAQLEAQLHPEPHNMELTKEAPPSYSDAIGTTRPANLPPPYAPL